MHCTVSVQVANTSVERRLFDVNYFGRRIAGGPVHFARIDLHNYSDETSPVAGLVPFVLCKEMAILL